MEETSSLLTSLDSTELNSTTKSSNNSSMNYGTLKLQIQEKSKEIK